MIIIKSNLISYFMVNQAYTISQICFTVFVKLKRKLKIWHHKLPTNKKLYQICQGEITLVMPTLILEQVSELKANLISTIQFESSPHRKQHANQRPQRQCKSFFKLKSRNCCLKFHKTLGQGKSKMNEWKTTDLYIGRQSTLVDICVKNQNE